MPRAGAGRLGRRRRHQAQGRLRRPARHDTSGATSSTTASTTSCVQGARPLFFLDYVAHRQARAGDAGRASSSGSRDGCRENGCALLGGETAEMPGFYPPGEYDLAGFIVGVVERDRSCSTARAVAAGRRRCSACPRAGLHTNGYSLARQIFFETTEARAGATGSPGDPERAARRRRAARAAPLLPRRRSSPLLAPIRAPRAGAHHRRRASPTTSRASCPRAGGRRDRSAAWPVPPVFELMQRRGRRRARGDVPRLQHGDRHGRDRRSRAPARDLEGSSRRPGSGRCRSGASSRASAASSTTSGSPSRNPTRQPETLRDLRLARRVARRSQAAPGTLPPVAERCLRLPSGWAVLGIVPLIRIGSSGNVLRGAQFESDWTRRSWRAVARQT